MFVRVVWLSCLMAFATPVRADQYGGPPTAAYDIQTRGIPKFVDTIYIDMRKITSISKFRSAAGHNYSDSTQFGATLALKGSDNRVENCRSMKHYFRSPDASVAVYAPVSGYVNSIRDGDLASTVSIISDEQAAFEFQVFHVEMTPRLVPGDRVTAGQLLGHHVGSATWSDIAVTVNTGNGLHLISYFEVLTDSAFETFKARGVTSREQLIITKVERDAAPINCSGFSQQFDPAKDIVALTGGAATQTISVATTLASSYRIGDPALTVTATSSAGLPVTVTSSIAPKVCSVAGKTVTWRRAGKCTLVFSQNGDPDTFAATPLMQTTTVVDPDASAATGYPRLGVVFPPFAGGVASYLRFFHSLGVAETIKLNFTDAATGKTVFQSARTIAPRAAVQFAVSDFEKDAPAGFVRPALYDVIVDPTSNFTGYLQHATFNFATGAFSNTSTCSEGIATLESHIYMAHAAWAGGSSYPSTVVVHNKSGGSVNHFLYADDAATATQLSAKDYYLGPLPNNAAQFATLSDLESGSGAANNVAPYVNVRSLAYPRGYLQHLVTNQHLGVTVDVSILCAVNFSPETPTPVTPLFTGPLFSGNQTGQQSVLRFYNGGASAGTVMAIFTNAATGAVAGTWTSPSIPAGAEHQFDISAIEQEIAMIKSDHYELSVQTEIDGMFQHLLKRTSDGTLSNISLCPSANYSDPRTLIGVHSSLSGYPGFVVVNNTSATAQTVKLGIYDARNGTKITTFTTASIPAGAQKVYQAWQIEDEAHFTPTPEQKRYVIKAEGAFTGFLQNLLLHGGSGLITDMTNVCLM